MGNCCYHWPYRSNFFPYFLRRNETPILSANYDTLMDLDYMEEPQLTFRIDDNTFTVPSYLSYVSNKPRPDFSIKKLNISSESTLDYKRRNGSRASLSHAINSDRRSSAVLGTDIYDSSATERLLHHDLDTRGCCSAYYPVASDRCPSAISFSPSNTNGGGNWAAVISLSGRHHNTSTTAVCLSGRNSNRRPMSTSFHNDHPTQEEEMDGPEISRLIRRYWPRDLNFRGFSSANSSETGNSRKSLCESQSSRSTRNQFSRHSSLHHQPKRPNMIHFRSDLSNDGSRTEPASYVDDFEPALELDWDDEPGAFGVSQRNSKKTTANLFESPFNSEYFDAQNDYNLHPNGAQFSTNNNYANLPTKETFPIIFPKNGDNCSRSNFLSNDKSELLDISTNCGPKQPSLMVDSGFVGYDANLDNSNGLCHRDSDMLCNNHLNSVPHCN